MHSFFENNEFVFPYVGFDSSRGSFGFSPELSVLASMLPWAVGEQAELKFLMQKQGTDSGLSAIGHALIVAFGMHRFSAEPLPKGMVSQQSDFLQDPVIKAGLEGRISEIESSYPEDSMIQHFFNGLRASIFAKEGFQGTTAISTLYAQVSEKEEGSPGSLTRMFLKRFRFPSTPVFDFMESVRFGTPGIRTRIFALNIENFDLDMAQGLNPSTQALAENMRFTRLHKSRASSCSLFLADFDSRVMLKTYQEYLPQ